MITPLLQSLQFAGGAGEDLDHFCLRICIGFNATDGDVAQIHERRAHELGHAGAILVALAVTSSTR
jgi:hypothetical protein